MKIKQITLCVLFISIALSLSGCFGRGPISKHSPANFPGSHWISADETIEFTMSDNNWGYGTLVVDDEILDVCFYFGHESLIQMSSYTNRITGTENLENWHGTYFKNLFYANIGYKSTYFEDVDYIKFYRTDTDETDKPAESTEPLDVALFDNKKLFQIVNHMY